MLFTVSDLSSPRPNSIAVHSLETGERRTLIQYGTHARYVPTGHLVYASEDELVGKRPLICLSFQLTGPPAIVFRAIGVDPNGEALFSVSESGSLAYIPSGASEFRLFWVDRQGAVEPLEAPPRPYDDLRLSPVGRRVAFAAQNDIWIYDIPRGALNPS